MASQVLFAPMAYARYEATQTLPAKFSRMLKKSGLAERVKGKTVAIKMHVGEGITYSTIPPVFIRILVMGSLLQPNPLFMSSKIRSLPPRRL